MNDAPPLVAVVCAPSAGPALRAAAIAWVQTLDATKVSLLCDRQTVLAEVVAEAAEMRDIGVAWFQRRGPTWTHRPIVGAVVFGLPDEAASARSAGIRTKEWTADGVLV